MSKDTRTIVDCHHIDCKADDKGAALTFMGSNSRGTRVQVKIHICWWHWPMLIRDVAKAWLPIRATRIREIESVDKALKSEGGA